MAPGLRRIVFGVAALVLAAAGCIAPNADRGGDDGAIGDLPADCPGHWHFMLHVRVHNESVPLDHPDFRTPGATELHWDTGTLVHVHPSISMPRCVPLSESLGALDVTLDAENLTLGPRHGALTGEYANTGGASVHVFLERWNATWNETDPHALLSEQLPDRSRLFVGYGALADRDLAWQLAQVPPIPTAYQ